MTPRISVIVAVYNPGPHFDDLVDSLLRQSLPPEDFEVLLCDDGSNEATHARIDAVAAEHPQFKVLKLEHSGWPGTPRNLGIDTAAGTYVFFCDHDDSMGEEALERLCDYADKNASDVVVGKMVGVGRALPRNMFRRNIPNAVLGTDPLLEILTPHKLFRTAFIRQQGIRFPDGKVRLEDHMFVMRAYFAADVISILADYPCYYWTRREDEPSASASLIDPEHYYRYLGEVLDIVERNVEPGPLRDSMLAHWYRGKVLKRLSGRILTGYPEEYRAEFWETARPFALKRFGPEVDAYLSFPNRIRSVLLRADRLDDLMALAEYELGLKAWARVTSIGWQDDDRLRLEVTSGAAFEDGSGLEFDPIENGRTGDDGPAAEGIGDGGPSGWRWRAPGHVAPDLLTDDLLNAGPDLAQGRMEIFVRARHDGADYFQPVEGLPEQLSGPGSLRTTITIDPRTARAGRAVTKFSDLVVQVSYAGWNFGTALRIDPEVLAAADLAERTIGRRAFTVRTRGSDRLYIKARRLPPPPPKPKPVVPVVVKPPPTLSERIIRKGRRIAGRARRRLLRVIR